MKKDVLFSVPSYFRDDMDILGYRFGKGEKSCAVLGALRGDEVQQLYVCARLVAFLREVERDGGLVPGKSVLVIPTAIGHSMNVGERLWAPEQMDINRCFPGDATRSTSERIASALFERLRLYRYGVQLTSFYQPGSFIPHVRMMDTGRQNPDLGCEFGLPYVYVRPPRSADTKMLESNSNTDDYWMVGDNLDIVYHLFYDSWDNVADEHTLIRTDYKYPDPETAKVSKICFASNFANGYNKEDAITIDLTEKEIEEIRYFIMGQNYDEGKTQYYDEEYYEHERKLDILWCFDGEDALYYEYGKIVKTSDGKYHLRANPSYYTVYTLPDEICERLEKVW